METITKKRPGRKPQFTLSGVEKAPIKAIGWAKKFPYQYSSYWNKRNKIQVEVRFNKKNEPYFAERVS